MVITTGYTEFRIPQNEAENLIYHWVELATPHKETMDKGTVKWFNQAKGYGFLTPESGQDVFVHFSAIPTTGYKNLREGDKIEGSIVGIGPEHNAPSKSVPGQLTAGQQKKLSAKDLRLLERYHRLVDCQIEGKLTQKDQKELQSVEEKLRAIEDGMTSQAEQLLEQRHRMMMDKLSELADEIRKFSADRSSASEPKFEARPSSEPGAR